VKHGMTAPRQAQRASCSPRCPCSADRRSSSCRRSRDLAQLPVFTERRSRPRRCERCVVCISNVPCVDRRARPCGSVRSAPVRRPVEFSVRIVRSGRRPLIEARVDSVMPRPSSCAVSRASVDRERAGPVSVPRLAEDALVPKELASSGSAVRDIWKSGSVAPPR